MSSPRAPSARALDAALSGLAAGVRIAHSGRFRLMVGPGGVFVLRPLEADEKGSEAVTEAETVATMTRERIAEHLVWVPFVDWFVVGDEARTDCTVLPPDLLAMTALERTTLEPEILDELIEVLDQGRLEPMWQRGIPAAWARLADPLATDTRHAS